MGKGNNIQAKMCGGFYNFTEILAYIAMMKRKPKNVVLTKNVKYGNEKKAVLDLIYDKSRLGSSDKQPILLYIHGGGWISGLRCMRKFYCYNYVEAGYFVFNIDYDYAPKHKHPHQLQQILDAVDFVFDNANKYNIDTSRIVLAGESAGGYFVTELATIVKDKSLAAKIGLSSRHLEQFDVCANIVLCGAIDMVSLCDNPFPNIKLMVKAYTGMSIDYIKANSDKEDIKLLSPTSFIKNDFPPTFIVYGAKDPLQIEAFALDKQLEELNVPHVLYKADGIISNHAFCIATKTKKGKKCFDETLKFVNSYVKTEEELN